MNEMIQKINKFLPKINPSRLSQNDDADRLACSHTILVDQRRQRDRLNISVPVWYQAKNKGSTKWIMAQSRNYSDTGMRITLPLDMTLGTEINIKLKLPEVETPISVEGVVAWIEPFHPTDGRLTIECGIIFDDLQNVPHKDKLSLFVEKRLGRFGLSLTKRLSAGPVESLADLKACYELIYKTYVKRGYCSANPQKMHFSYHCFLPKSRTFIMKDQDQLLGTVSLVLDSPCGLPMDSIFSNELNDLRKAGRKLAEVSLLAMAPDGKKSKLSSLTNSEQQARVFRLFKTVIEYARLDAGVTDLIIGVHPKHDSIYKFIAFETFGPVRNYPGAGGNPALPLRLDYLRAEKEWSKILKSFFIEQRTPQEIMNNYVSITSPIVSQFLFAEQPLWPQIPSPAQEYLHQCYPYLS